MHDEFTFSTLNTYSRLSLQLLTMQIGPANTHAYGDELDSMSKVGFGKHRVALTFLT